MIHDSEPGYTQYEGHEAEHRYRTTRVLPAPPGFSAVFGWWEDEHTMRYVFSPVVAWCERECETRQLKPHRGEWKAESGLTWMPLVLTIRGDGPELAPTASYVCDQGTYLGVILGTSEADFNQFQRERFEELLQEITEESARVDATLEQQRQARAAGGAA